MLKNSDKNESVEESVPEDDEVALQDFRNYEVISRLPISKWEECFHVVEKESDKEVALVSLNREKYLKHFKFLIEDSDAWEDEEDILKMAEEKFHALDKQFGARHAKILELPKHPILPKIFEVVFDRIQKRHFVVMEYVPGMPFLMGTGRLSPLQILGLGKELLEGLEFMHEHGFLHRRIKSENIFVRLEGRKPMARFSSWGLAVPAGDAQGDRSGARHYVAPEVLLQGKITEQADLWAIGSLLFQALTHEPPHPERAAAEDVHQLATIAKKEKPVNSLSVYPSFQNLRSDTSEELKVEKLNQLLMELLKQKPEERLFKNARSVIAFIEENWPQVSKGAPESKQRVSVSLT